MDIITAKAVASVTASGISQQAVNLGSIIQIITQILQGLSACNPTAPAVHAALTNPTPMQERTAERLVRRMFRRQPALQESILEGIYATGRASTIEETSEMYRQANGVAPVAQPA